MTTATPSLAPTRDGLEHVLPLKQAYVKGTDLRIVGTLEQIPGCACVAGFDRHDQPVYSGNTEVWWNGQRTETDPCNDQPIYVDQNLETRGANEIEFRDA